MKHVTKTFLALCAGPLVLAVSTAESSSADYTHLGCFNDHSDDRVFAIKMTATDLTTDVRKPITKVCCVSETSVGSPPACHSRKYKVVVFLCFEVNEKGTCGVSPSTIEAG